jgi:hypothetical protein
MAMRSVVSAIAAGDDNAMAANAAKQNALRMSMMSLPSDDRQFSGENQQVSGQPASRRVGGYHESAETQATERTLEHDPEKWKPVFRKDHAQTIN